MVYSINEINSNRLTHPIKKNNLLHFVGGIYSPMKISFGSA